MILFLDSQKVKIMKNPTIYKNILEEPLFEYLKKYNTYHKNNKTNWSKPFQRLEGAGAEFHKKLHWYLLPLARNHFESNTLIPTFNFFSWYEETGALSQHYDSTACTYAIDLCVSQLSPWDLFVDGIPYTLQENDALFLYGEDQLHWREEIPKIPGYYLNNHFFFYAEPDHWYFTEPQENHQAIINSIDKVKNNFNRNIKK